MIEPDSNKKLVGYDCSGYFFLGIFFFFYFYVFLASFYVSFSSADYHSAKYRLTRLGVILTHAALSGVVIYLAHANRANQLLYYKALWARTT